MGGHVCDQVSAACAKAGPAPLCGGKHRKYQACFLSFFPGFCWAESGCRGCSLSLIGARHARGKGWECSFPLFGALALWFGWGVPTNQPDRLPERKLTCFPGNARWFEAICMPVPTIWSGLRFPKRFANRFDLLRDDQRKLGRISGCSQKGVHCLSQRGNWECSKFETCFQSLVQQASCSTSCQVAP